MHRSRNGMHRPSAWVAGLVAGLLLAVIARPALGAEAPPAAGSCGAPGPLRPGAGAAAGVWVLQAALRQLGLDPGRTDGIYGPRTAAAVRQLQAGAGIPSDGVAGPQTLAALHRQLLLPHAPYTPPHTLRKQVVVDTRRHRLALLVAGYPVRTYPVSVGQSRTPSPIGEWRVTHKARDWGGGFGTRWIGLNVPWGIYGIHGTNKPWLLGRHVSGGCIRMRNQDVEELYELVPRGTEVIIFGDPLFHRRSLVEGHKGTDVMEVQLQLRNLGFYSGPVDGVYGAGTARAVRALQKARGLPVTGIVRWDTYRALGLLE